SEKHIGDMSTIKPSNDTEPFGMTPFALRMCRSANGVSEKHGEVSRELWVKMFGGVAASEVPITYVTNGVHPSTWIASSFQDLFSEHIGENWRELTHDRSSWLEAVMRIPDSALWRTHSVLKNVLIAFIRERTSAKDTGEQDTI